MNQAAKVLLSDLESCIRGHLLAGVSYRKRPSAPCLRGHILNPRLTWVLCCELLRNSNALRQFLLALLERWRKIDQLDSVWRRRMVIDQMSTKFGHDKVKHLEHLQEIGVIPKTLGSREQQAWLNVIGQDLARDLRHTSRTLR